MEKELVNYVKHPTLSPISLQDIRNYQLRAVSKEDMVRRIEKLEDNIIRIHRLDSMVTKLKKLEPELESLSRLELGMTGLNRDVTKLLSLETDVRAMQEHLRSRGYELNHTWSALVSSVAGLGMDVVTSNQDEVDISMLSVFTGDSITLGNYQGEAIEWMVLAVKEDAALLISRYGLDKKKFHERKTEIIWENSSLRNWLNGEFYMSSFSDNEKKKIRKTEVTNQDSRKAQMKKCDSTEDWIFLLSIDEVNMYFDSRLDRICQPTKYAKQQGIYVGLIGSQKGNCEWLLRTSGSDRKHVTEVDREGTINPYGYFVDSEMCAIRPAMWITL